MVLYQEATIYLFPAEGYETADLFAINRQIMGHRLWFSGGMYDGRGKGPFHVVVLFNIFLWEILSVATLVVYMRGGM